MIKILAKGNKQIADWFRSPLTDMLQCEEMALSLYTQMEEDTCQGTLAYIDPLELNYVGLDDDNHIVVSINSTAHQVLNDNDKSLTLQLNTDAYSNFLSELYNDPKYFASPLLDELCNLCLYDLNKDELGRFAIPRLKARLRTSAEFFEGYQTLDQCFNPEKRDTHLIGDQIKDYFKCLPDDVKVRLLIEYCRLDSEGPGCDGLIYLTTDPDGSHPFLTHKPGHSNESPRCYEWWTGPMEYIAGITCHDEANRLSPILGEFYRFAKNYSFNDPQSVEIKCQFERFMIDANLKLKNTH